MEVTQPLHVVFLQGKGAGHINPTIPLVAALCHHGCRVTYFADAAGSGDEVSSGSPLGKAVIAAGGTLRRYRVDPLLQQEPRLSHAPWHGWHTLPGLLEDLRALQPPAAVIVTDPFIPSRAAAARILSIKSCCVVPYSGPGIMAVSETAGEEVGGAREWLMEQHGLDLLSLGVPMQSWFADLNLVLCCEELFAPMGTAAQRRLYTPDCFRCVGTMHWPGRSLAAGKVDPPSGEEEGFPLGQVKAARASGKRVVLCSLGSMVTGVFFEQPLGRQGAHIEGNSDGATVGGKTLGELTGRDFIRFVVALAFEALGGRDDVVVVLASGKRGAAAVLEGMAVPSNFLPCAYIPQLDILPLCSAFVTHGGMGSVMESLLFRVPLIVVPVYGDQMWNADCVASAKLGVSFRYPLRTLHAEALREAVLALCDASPSNPYSQAVEGAASRMERTGGADHAAKLIMEAARS